jgi:hypothetical protein
VGSQSDDDNDDDNDEDNNKCKTGRERERVLGIHTKQMV